MITHNITQLPTAPSLADPTNFDTRADAFLTSLNTFDDEINNVITDINSTTVDMNNVLSSVNTKAVEIETNYLATIGVANYKGDYNSATIYSKGQSVTYNGLLYVSKIDANTNNTPTSSTTYWYRMDTNNINNIKTLVSSGAVTSGTLELTNVLDFTANSPYEYYELLLNDFVSSSAINTLLQFKEGATIITASRYMIVSTSSTTSAKLGSSPVGTIRNLKAEIKAIPSLNTIKIKSTDDSVSSLSGLYYVSENYYISSFTPVNPYTSSTGLAIQVGTLTTNGTYKLYGIKK